SKEHIILLSISRRSLSSSIDPQDRSASSSSIVRGLVVICHSLATTPPPSIARQRRLSLHSNTITDAMMNKLLLSFLLAIPHAYSFSPSLPSMHSTFTATSVARGVILEGREIEGTLTPTNNFVLVKVAKAVEQTTGGILLTGSAKIKKTEGLVISTGPGRTHSDSGILLPMPVTPGESVVYGKYDGTEIDYDGEKHALIRDEDILVKWKGEQLTQESAEVVRDNVLVRVTDNKEEETTSGLVIASTAKKGSKPSTGEVIKVGPGRMASNGEIIKVDIQEGDMVKFRDFAGNEVMIGDEEFAVVRMGDVLAKF
ncbi:hypothetical protein ACHAW6_006053, partial [Cyclotella cf. meneghiniana]